MTLLFEKDVHLRYSNRDRQDNTQLQVLMLYHLSGVNEPMSNPSGTTAHKPVVTIEEVTELNAADMNDLCDATDAAIQSGGGFGWVDVPAREVLERFWRGVTLIPDRKLFVGRLDGVIGGTGQLIFMPSNNEAQSFSATITNVFVAPWARGHGIAKDMITAMEARALKSNIAVLNLDVRETQIEAISLYEKMGFTRWGTKENYARVHGKILKGHFYSKMIDPSIIKNS